MNTPHSLLEIYKNKKLEELETPLSWEAVNNRTRELGYDYLDSSDINYLIEEKMVEYLNELLALDREWLTNIINARLECNQAIADHSSVQAGIEGEGFTCGFLGILNGFLGPRAPIILDIDEETGKFLRFRRRKPKLNGEQRTFE